MSGYAKRMMEAARPWMEANTVPFAGRIRVPRRVEIADGEEADMRAGLATLAHDDQAKGLRLIDEMMASSRRLKDLNDDYEKRLNAATIEPCSSASVLEDEDLLKTALASWFLSWGHEGYNVFDLSPDFVAALLLTDPASLGIDELRLPFRGLLVLLPDGFARDSGGGSFTKVHVCEVRGADGDILDITASSGRRVLSTSARADCVTLHGLSAFGSEEAWGVSDDQDRQVLRTMQHIVLGLAAYTASVAGSAERREPSDKRRPRREDARPVYWDVGRTVRIDPNLVRAARAGSREVALRLRHRHIVRGHYRQQPIGEGRKERKTIWIAPFWKGPAEGAHIVHTYKPSVPEPVTTDATRSRR